MGTEICQGRKQWASRLRTNPGIEALLHKSLGTNQPAICADTEMARSTDSGAVGAKGLCTIMTHRLHRHASVTTRGPPSTRHHLRRRHQSVSSAPPEVPRRFGREPTAAGGYCPAMADGGWRALASDGGPTPWSVSTRRPGLPGPKPGTLPPLRRARHESCTPPHSRPGQLGPSPGYGGAGRAWSGPPSL